MIKPIYSPATDRYDEKETGLVFAPGGIAGIFGRLCTSWSPYTKVPSLRKRALSLLPAVLLS